MITSGIFLLSSLACLLFVFVSVVAQYLSSFSHAVQFPPSSPLSPSSASSSSFSPSLCNPRDNSLFLADSSDRQAFFQCRVFAELPSIGFWERHFCPNGMHFAYATQQCTANSALSEVIRDSNEMFRIAILNGSCANGERCIGGTVCDQRERRCLCPQGTVAELENLYCATIPTEPREQSYQRETQWQWQQQRPPIVQPFSSVSSPVAQLQSQMNVIEPEPAMPSAAVPSFAAVPPGSDCSRGQLCGGGSVCLPSLGICLCTGGSENNGGLCLAAPKETHFELNSGKSQSKLIKASLGERCNENLGEYCVDRNARCEEGSCRCVVPMVEVHGKCQRVEAEGGKEDGKGRTDEQKREGSEKRCKICGRGTEKEGAETGGKEEAEKQTTDTTTKAKAKAIHAMVSISSAEGTTPKASVKKSKEVASVGEKCSLNVDCLSGAYCNGNTQPPTCQCLSTHVNVKDRCEKMIYPGQRGCETDLQCSAAYAGTRCIGRQCVCPPGSTPIDRSCIPAIAWPGERCNITQLMPVCSADSYCFGGRCVCNPPLHLFQKQCINQREDISILDEKTEEVDRNDWDKKTATKDVERSDGKGNGMHFDISGEKSEERMLNNERAEKQRKKDVTPEKVPKFEKNVGGKRRKTQMSGMEQIFSTLALLKSAALGELTAGGRDALGKGKKSKSDGKRHRRESTDGSSADWGNRAGHYYPKQWSPYSQRLEGEPCSPEDICLDGAECVDGRCHCGRHSLCKSVSPKTFRSIGSQCAKSADQCVGGSVCRNSTCICPDGSLPNVDKLHCRQSPGGRCSDGQKCVRQSECRLGTCHCRAGMRMASIGPEKRRKCVPTMTQPEKNDGRKEKLTTDDEVQRDDTAGGIGRSEAVKGRRRKKSQPGGSCAGDALCTGGSFCNEKSVCICAPGERIQTEDGETKHCALELGEKARNSGQSVKAEPGQLCVEGGIECAGEAKCQNGICICPEDHTLFRNECLPPRALPISVEKMHTHSIFFSPESITNMDTSTISRMDELNDLQDPIPSKTVPPGAMCRLSLECPYRTECLRGVCRCQRGETIVNGICRKIIHEVVLPGGRCDTQKGLDCVGESHCFYGICVCLYGLVNVGTECANVKVLEKVAPGKKCMAGQQCTGKAKCVKGKCQCTKGHKIDMKLRRCAKLTKPPKRSSTQVLAYPSEAELVARPTSIVEIPLGIGGAIVGDNGGGLKPSKFIYAIPAALAAAEGKFQQIVTANQMSINLLDQEMGSLINKLIDQKKGSSETIPKNGDNCVEGSGSVNCQQNQQKSLQLFAPIAPPNDGPFDRRPFQYVSDLSSSPQSMLQSSVSSPQPPAVPSPQPFQPPAVSNPSSSLPLSSFTSPQHLLGQPGHFCAVRHVCHGGAICLAGLCICRPGFRPIDGFCQIAKVNLGEQCFLDEQCKENGFCIGGFCQCRVRFGAIPSAFLRNAFHRRRCPARPVAAVGEDCAKGQMCGWNSICGTFSGVCECAIGMENDQGACVAARHPRGTECLSSSDCHKFAFCDNGLCSCKAGFERIDGFCLPPARPVIDDPNAYIDPETMAMLLWHKKGDNFESDKTDSRTQFGPKKRMFASGHSQAVHTPMSGGNYHHQTKPIEQRMDDSLPLEHIGRKKFPSEEHSPLLAEQYEQQKDAIGRRMGRHFGIGGHFQHRRLTPAGRNSFLPQHQQQRLIMHFPMRIPSHSAQHFSTHSNEKIKGAKRKGAMSGRKTTRERVKGQANDKKSSTKEGQQQEVAMPGEYCGTSEKQCIGNSVCLQGWCQCARRAHIENGGTCTNEQSKLLPLSESLLHSPHRPFDSCFSNRPCISGASCVRSAALNFVQKMGPFCQCNPGLIFLHNQCIPRRPELKVAKPGDRCHASSFICDFGSICGEENVCKCPTHRKLISGLCVHLALPGESCANGAFCAGESICAMGLNTCVCQVGWTVRNGKCHKGTILRKLMLRTERTRRKDRGSETAKGRKSAEKAIQSHSTTVVPKPWLLLGQSCQFDSDCAHLFNAYCAPLTRQCACRDGFLQLYASVCVADDRIKWPGDECISSAHYCAAQSWCKNGRCACIQKDAHVVDGYCVRKKLLTKSKKWRTKIRRHPSRELPKAKTATNDQCSSNWQCFGGAICTEKRKCECKGPNVKRNRKKRRSNAAEGHCTTGTDCPKGMKCREGKCFCPPTADEVEQHAKGTDQMSTKSEWFGKQEEEDGKAHTEWDHTLGEPVVGTSTENVGHQRMRHRRPQIQRYVVPILPGTFCDAFSQCGEGAKCFFGKCQCIFGDHRLAFVNGVTKCVRKEKEKQRWKRAEGLSNANCTKCIDATQSPKNSVTSNELRQKQNANPFGHHRQKTSKGNKTFLPGELCGPLDNCSGGSSCVEGFCLCPAGTRPSPTSGNCESIALQHKIFKQMSPTDREGQSNESLNEMEKLERTLPPTAITTTLWDHNKKSWPTATTNSSLIAEALSRNVPTVTDTVPIPGPSSAPSPPITVQLPSNKNLTGRKTHRQQQSVPSTEGHKEFSGSVFPNSLLNVSGKNERAYARPSEGCSSDEICTGGSVCNRSNNICECPAVKPILRNHICIPSTETPIGEAKTVRPSGELYNSETKRVGNSVCAEGSCRCQRGLRLDDVPCKNGQQNATNNAKTSNPKNGLGMLPPVLLDDDNADPQPPVSQKRVRMHSKPRISGPPLRRPSSPPSRLLAPAGTNGVCPPGNTPLTDQSTGLLIQCNGMTPNCPPKSYCFVTGVASEVYNCCKAY